MPAADAVKHGLPAAGGPETTLRLAHPEKVRFREPSRKRRKSPRNACENGADTRTRYQVSKLLPNPQFRDAGSTSALPTQAEQKPLILSDSSLALMA